MRACPRCRARFGDHLERCPFDDAALQPASAAADPLAGLPALRPEPEASRSAWTEEPTAAVARRPGPDPTPTPTLGAAFDADEPTAAIPRRARRPVAPPRPAPRRPPTWVWVLTGMLLAGGALVVASG